MARLDVLYLHHDLRNIGLIAGLMLAGCAANEPPTPLQLEVMRPRPAALADPAQLKPGPDGTLPLPERPGLGIELDPDALVEFSNAATRMHA